LTPLPLLLPLLLLLLLRQVREDSQRGIYVAGATEEYVTSAAELLAVMDTGKSNRVTAATGMNAGSSRSHSVFIITLAQRNTETSSVKTGALYLVDLAGSEMVKKTQVNSILRTCHQYPIGVIDFVYIVSSCCCAVVRVLVQAVERRAGFFAQCFVFVHWQ
jgi:Kinesin motor domain